MAGYFRELDYNISRMLTPVVKWIIYLCVGVFLVEIFYSPVVAWLGASVHATILRGQVWQLVTYALAHGSFGHLLFNLLAIYFFGTRLEERWGSPMFLRFVLIVGAGAVLTHLLVMLGTASATNQGFLFVKIIGISGVVYGTLLVYALYYPDDIVYLFAVFPMKVKYLVAIMGLLAFLASADMHSPVANLTHLGGMLFGYLFYKFPNAFDLIQIPRLRRTRRRGPRQYMGDGRWE